MTTDVIMHIIQKKEWEKAKTEGAYSPSSINTEGFIHFSTEGQVAKTLNVYYKEVPDLVLLHVQIEKIIPEVKWEDSDGDVFPHVYGPLNLDAVFNTEELKAEESGLYSYPQ